MVQDLLILNHTRVNDSYTEEKKEMKHSASQINLLLHSGEKTNHSGTSMDETLPALLSFFENYLTEHELNIKHPFYRDCHDLQLPKQPYAREPRA